MDVRARSPEELETLFEDAVIVRDAEALSELYEDEALWVTGTDPAGVRGRVRIARAASERWADIARVATPGRVLQAGGLALSIGAGVHVLRRDPHRGWRLAISLIDGAAGRQER